MTDVHTYESIFDEIKALKSISKLHTYIIGQYNSSVKITAQLLTSHHHVVCVNFIRERRDLQFNVDPERQIF